MDAKAYIESGILEQYVLGYLSAEEQAEVIRQAKANPEIRQELNAIESALEQYAILSGRTPPADVIGGIIRKIDSTGAANLAKIIGAKYRRWLLLLGVGIIAAGLGWYYQVSQTNQAKDQLNTTQQQFNQFRADCDSIRTEADSMRALLFFLQDTTTRKVIMGGTQLSPRAVASVYFNPATGRAYLGGVNLPTPPQGKQYQLWAIVAGQPQSMGVFDMPADSSKFVNVPYIANAQAFAVTLEDAGGKPTPTLEQMYVIGNAG